MKCPSLTECKSKKTCRKMREKGIDDEVSDFDVEHYCQGKPINCYFYRLLEDESVNAVDELMPKSIVKPSASLKRPNGIGKLMSSRDVSAEVQH